MWQLNKVLFKKWVNNKIKEEIRKYLKTNDNENTKSMECSKSSSKMEVHSNIGLLWERGKKTQIKNLNYHLKELAKEQTTQSQQRKELRSEGK